METIKSLIKPDISSKKPIQRFRYSYDETIAKQVWYGIALDLIGKVELTPGTKVAWNDLLRWAFADERSALDLSKSIGLFGQTGSGKSLTMEILCSFVKIDPIKYSRNGKDMPMAFRIYNAKQIASDYMERGYIAIDNYSTFPNICIDDLGAENLKVKHYGTELNVCEEIIENRHLKGLITHITSNLHPDDIPKAYGDRVYSRLMSDTNTIFLNDKDHRLSIVK